GGKPGAGSAATPGTVRAAKAGSRRWLGWVAFLCLTPLCLGGVLWAALGLNGSYPTVRPPVPPGWQPVKGIYASFSAPGSWSLQQSLSDSSGDIYYSGPGGSTGESVSQVKSVPLPQKLPAIVGTFLGSSYKVTSRSAWAPHNATKAWRYTFALSDGRTGIGVLAWVKPTQSQVWLVAVPASPTAEKVLSTLTLAA
ncbi:MAG: hypothetical protein ACRDZX_12985, partial [Acidimicrobiales bacterium]